MTKTAALAGATYVLLGLRNLRRHPRRTLLTLVSLVVGFAALTFLGAVQQGLHNDLRDNALLTLSGHLQVHATGFALSSQIQHHIPDPGLVIQALLGLPDIAAWSPRLQTSGLASVATASTSVQLLGIDSAREPQLSRLAASVVSGAWLTAADAQGLLLGQHLVEMLGVRLGDKVILMAQTPAGELVSELFRLRGILRAGVPEVDHALAVIPLATAQRMLGLAQGVTDVVIRATRHDVADVVWEHVRRALPTAEYEVLRWSEMNPLLQQRLEVGDVFATFVLLIVVVVVVVEALNVMLMALHERTHELGLMEALGTRKGQLFLMILWESVLLVMSGCLGGYGLGALLSLYLQRTGIDLTHAAEAVTFVYLSPVLRPVVTWQSAVHLIGLTCGVALLAALYPAWKATRLQPVAALRQR